MNPSTLKPSAIALACASALLLAPQAPASAQTAPDAGSLLQQIEQQRQPALPPKAAPQLAPPPPMESLGTATVTVRYFRFAGNTLLSALQLQPVVAGYLDKPLTFGQLQNAAVLVADAYRKAGWIVRVYLPKQDVTGGTVTFQVIEASYGRTRVEGASRRIAADKLEGIVAAAQPAGQPVRADGLDRALLLMDDLPGIGVKGSLAEGQNQGETDLVLALSEGPLFAGEVAADNTAARSTGENRISFNGVLNSPLRRGDLATGYLMHTEGSDYGRIGYGLPLGDRGWRVGINASHLSYKVVTPEFKAFDAHGTSTTAGLEASYPLVRARLHNLFFNATLDGKRFDNLSAGAVTTHYKVTVASLGLSGNLFDDLGGGGSNSASLGWVTGSVNLDGSPNQAADALTTRTAGHFDKLRWSASRQQTLTDSISLYGGLAGQTASKNLDSSEKFYLGGVGGVRAYPASEAGGSDGAVLNLEARARLPANFNATAFFDYGHVTVNHDNDFNGAARLNSYSLKGAGVSVGWTAPFGVNVKGTVARRIGENPNLTLAGNDQDGSHHKTRVWLQASVPF